MGCRLPKLRKVEDRQSPGNIYSTLRRPQVETKVGVAYTYHFLDFLLGKEEVPVSSVLCLSSVRELPVQVRELYAQGFVLVAVHPFVHPCGPRHAHIQRQLHRAVLVRETPSSEKSQLRWGRHRLETDVCVAGHQSADPDMIQSYVKKIQDVAEQGVRFVGFLQQPGGGPCFLGNWDPEDLSSLHSSPSPIHRHPFSANISPTGPTEPHHNDERQDLNHEDAEQTNPLVPGKPDISPLKPNYFNQQESFEQVKESLQSTNQPPDHNMFRSGHTGQWRSSQIPAEAQLNQPCLCLPEAARAIGQQRGQQPDLTLSAQKHFDLTNQRERRSSSSDSNSSSPELILNRERKSSSTCTNGQSSAKTHNNNDVRLKSTEKDKSSLSPPAQARMQLFALYNHSEELNTSLRFYSLRVPLQVQREAGLITEVDAYWLDHMTQHFASGAQLIDGFFQLEDNNDTGLSSVDSVFIFQNSVEEMESASYDAIVVEQWTIVDGVVVKTDYIPLLQSLAPYGWRLMCVLPTPIVKTYSDGSLSTKQILFLQRPTLQRKRKDFKMLYLRGRSKAKKKSIGGTQEEIENMSPLMETEMCRLRRNPKEEEEEAAGRQSKDANPEIKEDAWLEKSLLSGSRASVEEQEEETDVDEMPLSKQRSVRWTDVCHRDDRGGVKEDMKTEERLKQQLFSGVC